MITSSFLDKEVHVDDIDYGGVDNDGELDPCTKENNFDFEW